MGKFVLDKPLRRDRRRWLRCCLATALVAATGPRRGLAAAVHSAFGARHEAQADSPAGGLTLFLCGDLMSGRGIDQILPTPGDPVLHEPFLRDARDYLALAERVGGPIPHPVAFDYVWGDALTELARVAPDLRIVNLETAVTTHDIPWPKGINYRMHPANIGVLTVARIDCCVLANNHVLDWMTEGLAETLATLQDAGIKTAGAGRRLAAAEAPAILPVPGKGRVLVFAFAERYSGVAHDWSATDTSPGIVLLRDLSSATLGAIAERVARIKQPGDLALASIHWGGNWGYEIPSAQRRFAHGLIDSAQIDLVHGHSSHHVKGIEVYRGRPILYGCGDFLNDYEGIRGHEEFRADLGLMYFPTLDSASQRLRRLALTPTRIRRFRIERAAADEVAWLASVLNREGRALGTRVSADGQGGLILHWRDA
jgi:poly-gamma-glutamate capsule biosynthesis protein CapA/YwtB (metallophosphatase superfamily)